MSSPRKLNKALWTNLTRLRLLTKPDSPVRFLLEKSPFDDMDQDEYGPERDEYIIIGRIFPESDIYKHGSYRIEIRITSEYPTKPPIVRFATPIIHPNIDNDGTFCHQLLNNSSRWKSGTTLVEVVKAVVKHVDEPNPDYAINYEMGKRYMEHREDFTRQALEFATQKALPRD